MRKVTASAVILTALTGCSQSSGIPSAQWSFELPSGDKAQAGVPDAESLSDVALSADAQSFLGGTVGKNVMGPAFEQPTASGVASSNAPIGSKVSSIGRPGSREISRIALETAAITSSTSSRPDPVDRVRAYLRASGRPSALANRTPYASQVYLSALPTSDPAGISSFPVALPPSSSLSSGSLSSGSLSSGITSAAAPAIAFESSANNAFTARASSSADSAGLNQPEFGRDYSADLGFVETQAAYGDIAYPSLTALSLTDGAPVASSTVTPVDTAGVVPSEDSLASTNTTAADGLPQLAPAQPSDLSFLSQASQAAPPLQDESLSIGTAILRDLQRSSQQIASVGTANVSAAATPIAVDAASIESSETFNGDTSVSLVPSGSNDAPTLASLRQTMPQRDPSPLVLARQASTTSAPGFQLEFPGRAAVDGPDLEALNIEPPNLTTSVSESQASSPAADATPDQTSVAPSSAIEADVHSSSDSYSPLLEGLRTTESSSTIYVPIADEVSSSDLIQNAVMALGQGASTAALLEDIAFKDAFSSVLTSAALLSGEATSSATSGEMVAQGPLAAQSPQAGVIEITTQETNPSEAIKAFSSDTNLSRLSVLQQGVLKRTEGKRRQLITWR